MEHPSVRAVGDFSDGVGVSHLGVQGHDGARAPRPLLVSHTVMMRWTHGLLVMELVMV